MPRFRCGFPIRPQQHLKSYDITTGTAATLSLAFVPAVNLATAISQVGAVQYREHLQYLNAPVAEDVAPRAMTDDLAKDVKKPLILLMCAVACMLFIGCLNVANLLVARGAARQKEVAIRGALGAQRWTLVREQLTESLMICFAGGVAGVLLSLTATKWLAHAWKDLPSAQGIHVDGVVLGFVCAMVFAAALLAGLVPAVTSTGKAVFATLQASSRTTGGSLSRTALRKTLLTVEIGVTVVLLIWRGSASEEFRSSSNYRFGLRNRQRAHHELHPAPPEIRQTGKNQCLQ